MKAQIDSLDQETLGRAAAALHEADLSLLRALTYLGAVDTEAQHRGPAEWAYCINSQLLEVRTLEESLLNARVRLMRTQQGTLT